MTATLDAVDAIALLPRGANVLVAGATGESALLADAVMAAGHAIEANFTGIFVPGLNRTTYLPNDACRVETFFMTPELAAHRSQVDFLPLCYRDILARLRATRFDAALMMVSPPDAYGRCSFGPAVDFLAVLWPSIPLRIAQVNAQMPRTGGDPGMPVEALAVAIERATPMAGMAIDRSDPTTERIAAHVAAIVPDGATLQTGLGKVPGAILRALVRHRDLRIHSGLIGDAVVDLADAGALAGGTAVTAGVAIGSARLYRAIADPIFDFRPVSVTHDLSTIAAIPHFISINSALEVDLFGQAYAEVGPAGLMSGPGGASDFARGAGASIGGLRICALPATAVGGTVSRIVPPGDARGPVSLGRFDLDLVVTEHGCADLRGRDHHGRAAALIDVAAPAHREMLAAAWAVCAKAL